MGSKTNRKGRSTNALSDFIALERYLLRSVAWRNLKPVPRAAYIEVCFCYDGTNNGRIQMSARNLGDRLGVDKATASRALKQLETNGFIFVTRKSHFSQKLKTCSEYRLTAFKCNVSGDLASKEFTRWKPEVQNSVATTQPTSFTNATNDLKTTAKSPNQLQ